MRSPITPSDEVELDLIVQAQEGNREAFGELVLRYRKGVINVVYRMCGDVNLAEDVAQEAFIKAWEHLPSYQPKAPFRNWVYRIATNSARDVLRQGKETVSVDEVPLSNPDEGLEVKLVGKERAEFVRQAVLSLPLASRSVLVLREYEGLSYREISEALDIPIGTVMSRLNYARNAMRKILSGLLEA